jgi:hypothetical protein
MDSYKEKFPYNTEQIHVKPHKIMSCLRTHVIKRDSGWAVKRQGTKRASKVYPTQEEAIKGAKKMIKSSDVVIHKRDGSIREWIKSK